MNKHELQHADSIRDEIMGRHFGPEPSAPPPPEPQGACERSRLATCSLPVWLVEKMIRRLQQAIRIAQSSGCYTSADVFTALVCELRAHADRATERQPAENTKDEPRA
jgi:hypothetical protein